MGGRGGGSGGIPTGHPSGGKGKENFQSDGLGFQNYDSLKDALGEKGRPMGEAKATLNANPHFSGEYSEFSENCQRCVVAYEARRRGYDVTAQPTYKGDTMPQVVHTTREGAKYGRWQGAFKDAKPDYVGGKTGKQAQSNLEAKMRDYGDGARAVVAVQWRNGGGHVINVENRGGKIHYNDAQVGQKYIGKELFHAAKPGSVTLTRVDNLKFSERAKKMVTKDKW